MSLYRVIEAPLFPPHLKGPPTQTDFPRLIVLIYYFLGFRPDRNTLHHCSDSEPTGKRCPISDGGVIPTRLFLNRSWLPKQSGNSTQNMEHGADFQMPGVAYSILPTDIACAVSQKGGVSRRRIRISEMATTERSMFIQGLQNLG